jgi:lipopolysaccharide transport system ATP-binding protein
VPGEVLVTCQNVSKKFCRGLKRSLWYGVQDICAELNPLKASKSISRDSYQQKLRKDEFWAVNDINFELKRGECLGLIGHNGAGKSTLLKMLNGLIKPDRGKITMKGRIGALIELNAGFNPILTGRENVYIYGTILGFTKQEIDQKYETIVDFAEMGQFMEMPFRSYSSGMKVRLGFAVAAQMEPDVLIIDEVLAVGDAGFRIKCLNRIHELLGKTAVIFVSHSISAVTRICDRIIVMRNGSSLINTPDVPTGVDTYFKEFKADVQKVYFHGDIEIEKFLVNGIKSESSPVINAGESIQLEIEIKINTTCKRLGIKIFLFNKDQRPIVTFVTKELSFFNWEHRSNNFKLRVILPNLYFASGRHSINIEIFDYNNMQILHRIENAASFIMGHHISIGCDSFQIADWDISFRSAS